MKKLTTLLAVAVLTVSFAAAFATGPATTPETTATTTATAKGTTPTAEEQAKVTCEKQGLTGYALDECVKKEVAKVSSSKPAVAPTTTAPAQPSN